jgi:hypothetical protein
VCGAIGLLAGLCAACSPAWALLNAILAFFARSFLLFVN